MRRTVKVDLWFPLGVESSVSVQRAPSPNEARLANPPILKVPERSGTGAAAHEAASDAIRAFALLESPSSLARVTAHAARPTSAITATAARSHVWLANRATLSLHQAVRSGSLLVAAVEGMRVRMADRVEPYRGAHLAVGQPAERAPPYVALLVAGGAMGDLGYALKWPQASGEPLRLTLRAALAR